MDNKKLFAYFLLIASLTLLPKEKPAFAVEDGKSPGVNIKIDGVLQTYPQFPVIINSRVLVPLRGVFESLGAEVHWDEKNRSVSATKGETAINLKINDPVAYKNGQVVQLDQPAVIINDRTMVPVRFVSEALGASVAWDEPTKTVLIDRAPVQIIQPNSAGYIVVSKYTLPEANGEPIPIYVPKYIDSSNAEFAGEDWITIKTIDKKSSNKLADINWYDLLSNYIPDIYKNEYTPKITSLFSLLGIEKKSKIECEPTIIRIIIQKEKTSNYHRAIVQLGDLYSRTSVRRNAGKTIYPLTDWFLSHYWPIIRVSLYRNLELTSSVDYGLKATFDARHNEAGDLFIGYLSINEKDEVLLTPKLYPDDHLWLGKSNGLEVNEEIDMIKFFEPYSVGYITGERIINTLGSIQLSSF